MDNQIIKRGGRKEEFDERKVYASTYAACLNTHIPKEAAEKIAATVAEEIKDWISEKAEVDSNQLFEEITKSLEKINTDAGFMYKTHRDLS
ncbi:hypothetical protein IID21_00835 [Patescibacteria group bacterium]|nr:hypothetical protein [Patescibacteria group bacterium]